MLEIIKINEDTYRIEDDGVRFFLLIGTKKALMIDSGMKAKEAKSICSSLTLQKIELLNTHADIDHISGNNSFDSFYMSILDKELYKENNGQGEINPIEDGMMIDLGERILKIISIPGHTPGSVAILDQKYRVLYSGDTVQDGRIFMFGKFRNKQIYKESLIKLDKIKEKFDFIYPSHGSIPVQKELIGQLIDGIDSIMKDNATGKIVNLFGKEVTYYAFPYASFLCD